MAMRLPSAVLLRIFRHLFEPDSLSANVATKKESPPSGKAPSALHRRVVLFRRLTLVHRTWRDASRRAFIATVPALTGAAVRGLTALLVANEGHIRRYFTETEVSFAAFVQSESRRKPSWDPPLWLKWQELCAALFEAAPYLRVAKIDMDLCSPPRGYSTDDPDAHWVISSPLPRHFRLLGGIYKCTNLKSLTVHNPHPFPTWGGNLHLFDGLRSLSLTTDARTHAISGHEVVISPPASLRSLTVGDVAASNPDPGWQLSNRVWRVQGCTDLQELDYRCSTCWHISFTVLNDLLCSSATLRSLSVDARDAPGEASGYVQLIAGPVGGRRDLRRLEKLTFKAAAPRTVLSQVVAPNLRELRLDLLYTYPQPGAAPSDATLGLLDELVAVFPRLQAVYRGGQRLALPPARAGHDHCDGACCAKHVELT